MVTISGHPCHEPLHWPQSRAQLAERYAGLTTTYFYVLVGVSLSENELRASSPTLLPIPVSGFAAWALEQLDEARK